VTLHPRGRHFLDAGMKIKGRPNANLHRFDSLAVFVGKQILFGATQTNKHQPSAAAIHPIHDGLVFLRRERSEGRRFAASNLELGEEEKKLGRELFGHRGVTPIEIDGDASRCSPAAKPEH
jgi:hypothetical protein